DGAPAAQPPVVTQQAVEKERGGDRREREQAVAAHLPAVGGDDRVGAGEQASAAPGEDAVAPDGGSDQEPDRGGAGEDGERPQHDLAAVVRGDDDEALEEREQRLVVQGDRAAEGGGERGGGGG